MVISANCAVGLEKAGVVNVVVAIHLPRRQNHSSKGGGRREGGGGVRNQEQCRATTRTNNNNEGGEGIKLRSHPANRGPTLGEHTRQHMLTKGERRKYDNSLGSRFWDRKQDAVLTSSYFSHFHFPEPGESKWKGSKHNFCHCFRVSSAVRTYWSVLGPLE